MSAETQTEDWSAWVGRTETVSEVIDARRVAALAATLDVETVPGVGDVLPPAWHWLFFNPFVRRRELGSDGHPKRGGFLPPVPLPRRMWAGGRLVYSAPVRVGQEARRVSEIAKVENKSGKRGQLIFVTVRHIISCGGNACITEEQDIVYREATPPGAPAPRGEPAPESAPFSQEVTPDPVLLFRYSALTSNGHRIHYDRPYAREEEGYRDLVVHGPLTSTLLHGFALQCRAGAKMTRFDFRGVAPLFVDRPFLLQAGPHEAPEKLHLWARGPDGEFAMKAEAAFD